MNSKSKESSRCDLCNVELVSIQAQLEHDFSLMHHMQLHQKHSKLNHRCSLCRSSVGQIKNYIGHLNGHRHQKSLKLCKLKWEKCAPTIEDLSKRSHVVNYSKDESNPAKEDRNTTSRKGGNDPSTSKNFSNTKKLYQTPTYFNHQHRPYHNYTQFGSPFTDFTHPPNHHAHNMMPPWRNNQPYGNFNAYNRWNWLQSGPNQNNYSWNANYNTGNWEGWQNNETDFCETPSVNPTNIIQLTPEPQTSVPLTEKPFTGVADPACNQTDKRATNDEGQETRTARHRREPPLPISKDSYNASVMRTVFFKSPTRELSVHKVVEATEGRPQTEEEQMEVDEEDNKAAVLKQIKSDLSRKKPRVISPKGQSKFTLFLSSDSETENEAGVDTGHKSNKINDAVSSDGGDDPKQSVEKGKEDPYNKALLNRLVNFPCNRKQQLQLAKWVQEHSKNKKKLLFPRFNLQLVPPDKAESSEADLKQVLSEITDLPMETISALVEALKQEELIELADDAVEGAREEEEPEPRLPELDSHLPRDHVGEPQNEQETTALPNVFIKPDPDAPVNSTKECLSEENHSVPVGFEPVDPYITPHSEGLHTSPQLPRIHEHSCATLESPTIFPFHSPVSSIPGATRTQIETIPIPIPSNYFNDVPGGNVTSIRQCLAEQENLTLPPETATSTEKSSLPYASPLSPTTSYLNNNPRDCSEDTRPRTHIHFTADSPEPAASTSAAGTSHEKEWTEMPSWIRRPSPEPPLIGETRGEGKTENSKTGISDPHSIVDQLLNLNKEEEQLREQSQKVDQIVAQMYEIIEEWKQKKLQIQQKEIDMRQQRQNLLQILQGSFGQESSDDAAASSSNSKSCDPPGDNIRQNVTYLGTLDSTLDIMQQLGMNVEPDSSNVSEPGTSKKKGKKGETTKKKGTAKKNAPKKTVSKEPKRKGCDTQSSEDTDVGKKPRKKRKVNEAAQQASMLQELLCHFAKDTRAANNPASKRCGGRKNTPSECSADSSTVIIEPFPIETFGPLQAHASAVLDIKNYDGFLYTCSADKTAKRFDIKNPSNCVIYEYHEKTVSSIQLVTHEEKGDVIFTASHDGYLRCFEAQSGTVLFSHYTGSAILCLAQAWGQLFLGLSNGQIWPYKISSGKFLDIFESSLSSVSRIATGSEGLQKVLCIVSYDGSVAIRNALTGLLIRLLDRKVRPPCCLQVDGTEIFITTTDRNICVYDLTSGRLLKKIACPSSATGLHVLRKYVLSCSFDGFIRCYRRKDWTLHRVYYGAGKTMAMCFDVSGGWMFSGNRHGIVEALKSDHSPNATCYFEGCKVPFGYFEDLQHHLREDHMRTLTSKAALQYVRCPWGDCPQLLRGTSGNEKIRELDKHIFLHAQKL